MNLRHHPDYQPKEGCSCGAEDAMFDFVPDTIFGLSIREVCCCHDFRYSIGGTEEDRLYADQEFMYNMDAVIANYDKWWYPHFFARHRAMTYYHAVRKYGKDAFKYKVKD